MLICQYKYIIGNLFIDNKKSRLAVFIHYPPHIFWIITITPNPLMSILPSRYIKSTTLVDNCFARLE